MLQFKTSTHHLHKLPHKLNTVSENEMKQHRYGTSHKHAELSVFNRLLKIAQSTEVQAQSKLRANTADKPGLPAAGWHIIGKRDMLGVRYRKAAHSGKAKHNQNKASATIHIGW